MEEKSLRPGDIVRTRAFGYKYKVVAIDRRGIVECEPLDWPQWRENFFFPLEAIEKIADALPVEDPTQEEVIRVEEAPAPVAMGMKRCMM